MDARIDWENLVRSSSPCQCGKTAALKYRSEYQVVTVVGAVKVKRKYYRCVGCKCGVVLVRSDCRRG